MISPILAQPLAGVSVCVCTLCVPLRAVDRWSMRLIVVNRHQLLSITPNHHRLLSIAPNHTANGGDLNLWEIRAKISTIKPLSLAVGGLIVRLHFASS